MNNKRWLKGGIVMVFGLAVILFAFRAQGRVVGTLSSDEYFPEMMEKKPYCGTAYNEFVATARPLKACADLEDAKANLEVQNALIYELSGMKRCRECDQKVAAAREARAGYQEQVRIYSKECPEIQKQQKLIKKVNEKSETVCKKCRGKWPGQIGLYGVKPCSQ